MKPIDAASPRANNPLHAPKVTVTSSPVPRQAEPETAQPGPSTATTDQKVGGRVHLLTEGAPHPIRLLLKIVLGLALAVAVGFAAFTLLRASALGSKVFVGEKTTFVERIRGLFRGSDHGTITGNRTEPLNVLLLGIGGEGHDGPYLSDTIMVAQIKPATGEVLLTSIPRDYLVTLPENLGQRKINSAFAEGFNRNKSWSEGGRWARETVERLTGLSIPYFAVVDFKGFERAIDEVGGIDVDVERAFTDLEYPNGDKNVNGPICSAEPGDASSTCRYLRLHFDAGTQHLNGSRALMFARSRHGSGSESSDFARSQRQQKVVQAFKDKVGSLNLVRDAGTVNRLLGVFADHFHTNLGPRDLFDIYRAYQSRGSGQVYSLSLDPDTGLICPQVLESNGAYVLSPCPGKSSADVRRFFADGFTLGKLSQERATVWLSADHSTAAYRSATKALRGARLTVFELPYERGSVAESLLYQVNPKPGTAAYLKDALGLTEVTLPPPGYSISKDKVDIVIILTENGSSTPQGLEPLPKP